eukprot:SAG11_NODE_35440_length_266_cov_1.233533_1_plen_62_part_01
MFPARLTRGVRVLGGAGPSKNGFQARRCRLWVGGFEVARGRSVGEVWEPAAGGRPETGALEA